MSELCYTIGMPDDEEIKINKSNVIVALQKLQKRVQDAVAVFGVKLNEFAVLPASEGRPPFVQMSFGLTAESVESAEQAEAKRVNAEFEAMMAGGGLDSTELNDGNVLDDDEKAKAEDIRKLAQKWLDES